MDSRSLKERLQEQINLFAKIEHNYHECQEGITYLNAINRFDYYPRDRQSQLDNLLKQSASINRALITIEDLKHKIKEITNLMQSAPHQEEKSALLETLIKIFQQALPLFNIADATLFKHNYKHFVKISCHDDELSEIDNMPNDVFPSTGDSNKLR